MQGSPVLKSKLKGGISIFSVVGQLAAEYKAINLWQGAPSFTPNSHLVESAFQAIRDGFNQYSPMPGVLALRQVLADKTARLYGAQYDPNTEITVTAGGLEAAYAAITALVHAGDEVIYFEPAFECYEPTVRLQGATPVPIKIPLDTLKIDWDEVAAAITPRTRMIVINSPHNPTGAVLDQHDIERLTSLTRGTDIVILSDEVYEHMVYDGKAHCSMAQYPELAARSVVIFSLGKTFHVTGWRVGYCVAPAEIMKEIRMVHQYLVYSAPAPFQIALAAVLEDPANYVGLSDFYQKKRDLLIDSMKESSLKVRPCASGFFLLADFTAVSNSTDRDFVLELLRRKRVGTIPLSHFYSDDAPTGKIRLSFCQHDDVLREGGRLLSSPDL
ncbi:methionine aminotransferase [Paraburkholderia rhizosphaerae]|uniref:2-keto-4-methylthiobutyrate aminotransferase n=1 Tax=Paraburkholderia rhizosphaerae TaxID=480658 RepID=A0A4R8LWM0_9BURK|nr:methionine aminotransferase [Paraburkholderia rhizosphaerae]TDY52228.1 2-keto-4-methylthiobutyrate aminotransferase [Paraburkholderia rhizosphaerae]